MAAKTIHIVQYGYHRFGFDSINKAADAVKFFSSLKKITYDSDAKGGFFTYEDDEDAPRVELTTNQRFLPRKPALGLPAPRRGTVPCSVCENVSVKPGNPCQSCGTVAELP